MPRHNWRAAPTGQRWCPDCKDFRPIDMFAELPSQGKRDNYCSFHRAARRKASRRKYSPAPLIECPHCHAKFRKP